MGKRLNLLHLRKKLGLTQKELAEKLGISSTHYSRIETGESNPSFELMESFKEAFEIEDVFKLFEKC